MIRFTPEPPNLHTHTHPALPEYPTLHPTRYVPYLFLRPNLLQPPPTQERRVKPNEFTMSSLIEAYLKAGYASDAMLLQVGAWMRACVRACESVFE